MKTKPISCNHANGPDNAQINTPPPSSSELWPSAHLLSGNKGIMQSKCVTFAVSFSESELCLVRKELAKQEIDATFN